MGRIFNVQVKTKGMLTYELFDNRCLGLKLQLLKMKVIIILNVQASILVILQSRS